MFEARILEGAVLKKIIAAIQDLVTDANLDCSEKGISMQAMDSSHVSLCFIELKKDGFDAYRCDKPFTLGVNTPNLAKVLRCAANDDVVTLKCEEKTDNLTLVFESQAQDRISDFEFKLMEIESEHLGIPDSAYQCTVRMPSAEFQRIIRDIQQFGDACTIAVSKEGIRFSATGDVGTGNIMLKPNSSVDKDADAVVIQVEDNVKLNFALRYLSLFTKATALGPTVTLSMSPDIPIVVEYPIEQKGVIRYYLAPKIDDD